MIVIIHRSEKVDDDSIFSAGVPNQVKIVEYPSEIIEDRVTLTWRAPEDNGTVVTQYTVYQMPHSHQSLNMFKSCFVKHSLIFFSS